MLPPSGSSKEATKINIVLKRIYHENNLKHKGLINISGAFFSSLEVRKQKSFSSYSLNKILHDQNKVLFWFNDTCLTSTRCILEVLVDDEKSAQTPNKNKSFVELLML